MNTLQWIHELSEKIGRAPRDVTPDMRRVWALPDLPQWAARDPLAGVWEHHSRLLATGDLALSCLVMANNTLFEPGHKAPAPATLAWTRDVVLTAQPERLQAIAHLLFRFYFEAEDPISVQVAPTLRRLSSDLRTGRVRPLGQVVPVQLTRGALVYYTTVMVVRDHLPGGLISGSFLPILTQQAGPGAVAVVVPGELWPEGWAQAWREGR